MDISFTVFCLFVCLFVRRILVTDISGAGWRRAMTFYRVAFDDLEVSKIKVILFDVKYVKNGNSHGVVPIGFTLDDLERLKVKVTNGAVTAIGMWGYKPVGLTGVLVCLFVRRNFGNGYLGRGLA